MDKHILKTVFEKFLREGEKNLIPQLSIDCVIFGFHDGQLKVLLLEILKRPEWVLPSGYVYQDEDLDSAALRNLKDRTNLENIFLRQFHTFGQASRYFPDIKRSFLEELGIDPALAHWLLKRYITVGYYALVNFMDVSPKLDIFSTDYIWKDVNDLPVLLMDREEIIQKALNKLRTDLHTQPVGANLLPETFTMPELQRLYETILGRSIDRGNFRKKMLKSNILKRLEKKKTGQAHRAPYLYRFDPEIYEESLQEGIKIGF